MQKNYIVTQCYGNKEIFLECAFLLLSLSRMQRLQNDDLEVHIYTDNPEWFLRFADCPLPLFFHELSPDILKNWRGKIDFVHRVKIEALLNFTLAEQGNVLYLDTDVQVMRPFGELWQAIGAGELFMHINEGIVASDANIIFAKLHRYLKDANNPTVRGLGLEKLAMWNAGAMGFHSGHRAKLDAVRTFTDQVYPEFEKHVVEQFAFSVVFQQAGPVHALHPWILHYWNLKELRKTLASFFEHFAGAPWDVLVRHSELINIYELSMHKMRYYRNQSPLHRLMGKRWEPAPIAWNKQAEEAI